MTMLREAGIIAVSQGKSGITLARGLADITFYDVYEAVDCVDDTGLFHFHENPNAACPVGRNIHKVMDERLAGVQRSMEAEMKTITLEQVISDTRKCILNE
ncbi:MAG: Rrf2 family transcriptional regulator, partial [Lachnospiraceae bacterium]|nr:Rrf2 family transcriptional regulator [Lachnospiraceae bacterium]